MLDFCNSFKHIARYLDYLASTDGRIAGFFGTSMKLRINRLAVLVAGAALSMAAHGADKPHNVILFVPDGLRSQMVRPKRRRPWRN
ncbi:hypothetical protein [Duganella vulcania]|uniref:Uncharacterized protein n=1 Tax=Duganella vulcania TaxID=2692166 RepID=A0A845GUS0_9BURK|nr:hypothetical protein [Duganella vulcania]MYM96417.1 hypothetical protein [Duganella vulcania]